MKRKSENLAHILGYETGAVTERESDGEATYSPREQVARRQRAAAWRQWFHYRHREKDASRR